MMDRSEEIFAQIKMLSASVTEETYDVEIQKGFNLLVKLHDLGIEKGHVYQVMLQYHNRLEDSLSRDYIADILDHIVGWCPPQDRIWSMD